MIYKKCVFVFIFQVLILFFLTPLLADERKTVYVFPPTLIGDSSSDLGKSLDEALRKELNKLHDLVHNPTYDEATVNFFSRQSDQALDQLFYGDCRKICLDSIRNLIKKMRIDGFYHLTSNLDEETIRIQLLKVDSNEAREKTAFCEKCEIPEIASRVQKLVWQVR